MNANHPKNALPLGSLLKDEYRVEAVLGVGGFAITYLATDGFGRPVAIKEYLPNELAVRVGGDSMVGARASSDSADFQWGLEKFEEEGHKLAAFDHPHINRVLRLFKANGTAYLVLEYVHGQTLSQVLAQAGGPLPAEQLRRLVAELLQALEVVHGAGLVHCDIKPSNIVLREEDGSAVLLDFGASRLKVSQRTRSAMSAFTPPYAAIEQYERVSPDLGPWTDLYGLGVLVYRGISGRDESDMPDAPTRAKWKRRGQQHQDLEPAIQAGAGRYPRALLEAVDWALALEERERPESAHSMAKAMGVLQLEPSMPDQADFAFFSPGHVAWASFLGSPVAGGTLLALNYYRMCKRVYGYLALFAGFILTVGSILTAGTIEFPLPHESLLTILVVMHTFSMYQAAKLLQGRNYREHLARGRRKGLVWVSTVIGLIYPLIFLVLIAVATLLVQHEPSQEVSAASGQQLNREDIAQLDQAACQRGEPWALQATTEPTVLHQCGTGLFWTRSDNGVNVNRSQAQAHCRGLGSGWSLPTVAQLQSLHDRNLPGTPCGSFTCGVSNQFRLSNVWFWSSEANGSSEAWYVDLNDGDRGSYRVGSSANYRALCVRRP